MAIEVAPGTLDLICDYADGFVVAVTGASDVRAAATALRRARLDIQALGPAPGDVAGAVISDPVLGPEGPMMRVARLDVPEDILEGIPGIVTARLEEAGVVDASVSSAEPGGVLDELDRCPQAVVLRLFPPPAGEDGNLPAAWIDIAGEWVLGDLAPGDTVPLRLLGIEYDVRAADAPAFLHQAGAARAWCDVLNGDLQDRIRTTSITFGRAPHVALAAGGPACDSQALLARYELLSEVAREYAASVSYACLDIEPTFAGIGLGLPGTGWRDNGGASPNLVAGTLSDILVPDAYPYQILGPGHLARMGLAAVDRDEPPLGTTVADGKVELAIGDPVDWLPFFDGRPEVLEDGWEVLAPLLATDEEVTELLDDRAGRTTVAPTDRAQPTAAGLPDLDDIIVETVPHSRRGLRLTLLELTAWLAHEPHTDAPATVSPVLATYVRWFASVLGDEARQALKGRAQRLIGTATPARRARGVRQPLSPEDTSRTWLATDWLIRVQAASWLELAGLAEAAAGLTSTGAARDRPSLEAAGEDLSTAITLASRQIDLTASRAGAEPVGDAALPELAAWEAWEGASEAAGWVAASEAASTGVPAELAYATDLQVIELARDRRRREELEALGASIADAAWAAARQAVADEAWTAGWNRARAAIDALAGVPWRTAQERGVRAALSQTGDDDDAREAAFELAASSAMAQLARAARGPASWTSDQHPWDAALSAAAATTGGRAWAMAQEAARAAVEEGPWAAGMKAARGAVDEVLRDAPDLVARAVGGALAREASGTAARAVALRSAAMARAGGATGAETVEAAELALAPTVAELQEAAFGLLDDLIHVGGDEPRETG